ncbi:MAG: HAD hydrolase-like protein [Candidatus Diapherotrites archaeon]|nr:HAD hydrolase-like protein [Candidatus Diapherotrites archaeon]
MATDKKLLLFDIDKTLTFGVNVHRKAFHGAFEKVYGVKTTVDIIDHRGMTDLQIVLNVLKKVGLSECEIKAKFPKCVEFMVKEFNKHVLKDTIKPTPGAKELLDFLSSRDDVFLAIVTGNLEPIGWGKLKKAGLAKYFSFGAFGTDSMERNELARIAIRKALKEKLIKNDSKVFLFGDTQRDMIAAKSVGAIACGVLTGDFSADELKAAGADFVFRNLEEKKLILEAVGLV